VAAVSVPCSQGFAARLVQRNEGRSQRGKKRSRPQRIGGDAAPRVTRASARVQASPGLDGVGPSLVEGFASTSPNRTHGRMPAEMDMEAAPPPLARLLAVATSQPSTRPTPG